MIRKSDESASRMACQPSCDQASDEVDEALLARLARRPLPAPSQRHRGRVLGQARTEMARRRALRCAQAGGSCRSKAAATGAGSSTWRHALLKPQVLASGSAAAFAAMLLCLWGWPTGALRQAGAPENADAVLSWTGTTGGVAASGTVVDLDAHLDRVRERVAGIVGGQNDSNIDHALTRTRRSVAELASATGE